MVKEENKYYLFEMKNSILQVISTLILVIMVLITWTLVKEFNNIETSFAFAFIFMIPYMVIHEIIHSIAYVVNGAKLKNITYGMHLEKGILCCLCKQNISKRNILISLLSPFFIIGVVTYIIGLLLGNWLLIILSIYNLSGCSGDIIMFIGLYKIKKFEFSEYDNPMAFGLYTSEDLSKINLFGLKYLGSVNQLDKKDFNKVNVGKNNIWFILIYFMIGLLLLML